jgi:hypothetical protein
MTSKHRNLVNLLVSTLVCTIASPAWGQEARASLGGRVVDPQGAMVPNAAVAVISDDTGVQLKTTTNPEGNWLVQFLIPGNYRFTVTAAGFKQAERTGISLLTADNKSFDVQLEVGASTQQVQVSADSALIDTTSATSGTVISPQEVTEMPNSSRIPTLFAFLAPGVQPHDQNGNNVDAGIYKNFRMSERFKLQYRCEAYNLFNHVRFGGPRFDSDRLHIRGRASDRGKSVAHTPDGFEATLLTHGA